MPMQPQPVENRNLQHMIAPSMSHHQQANKVITVAIVDLVQIHRKEFIPIDREKTAEIIVNRCLKKEANTIIVDQAGKLAKTIFHASGHDKTGANNNIIIFQELDHLR